LFILSYVSDISLYPVFLQSELERERIALELEEEKKAQAQRERVLQEQAKKIKNLSSMVLLSNRDEKREQDHFKKVFPVSSINLLFDNLRVYNSMARC